MIPPKSILVPVDFSDACAAALAYAVVLAEQFKTTLSLLHVVEPLHVTPAGADIWSYSPPGLIERLKHTAETHMAKFASEHEPRLTIKRTVRLGQPFPEIIRYAREEGIDLIVMGTHGRGGTAHTLLGSVAAKLVHVAPCPVLTVRRETWREGDEDNE